MSEIENLPQANLIVAGQPFAQVLFTRDLTATVTVLFAYPFVLVPLLDDIYPTRRKDVSP
jgi:hypothetical protein